MVSVTSLNQTTLTQEERLARIGNEVVSCFLTPLGTQQQCLLLQLSWADYEIDQNYYEPSKPDTGCPKVFEQE